MKNTLLLFFTFLSVSALLAQNEKSIEIALLAAPEELRDEATVKGYNENGEFVILREGTNNIICIADDPNKEGISVTAYYSELEPFMERGRQLRKEGKKRSQVFEIRGQEIKAGKLKIPQNAILYSLSGKLDEETGEILDPYYRWVVYTPYATAESTGLSTSPPAPGAPWLMDAGSHRAHIMITPPKGN